MKLCVRQIFSRCAQIRYFLRICSYLLKKPITENFIFCMMIGFVLSKKYQKKQKEIQGSLTWVRGMPQNQPVVFGLDRSWNIYKFFPRVSAKLSLGIFWQLFRLKRSKYCHSCLTNEISVPPSSGQYKS